MTDVGRNFLCPIFMAVVSCSLLSTIFRFIEPIKIMVEHEHPGWLDCSTNTKCLNTGILVSNLVMSASAFKSTENNSVNARSTPRRNAGKVDKLARLLLSPSLTSQLLYVIMTDGKFAGCEGTPFFPGHVFVIEKLPRNKGFQVIQTFIGMYDTTDARVCQRRTLSQMRQFLEMLRVLYGGSAAGPTWTAEMHTVFCKFAGLPPDYNAQAWIGCRPSTSLDFQYRNINLARTHAHIESNVRRWLGLVARDSGVWRCGPVSIPAFQLRRKLTSLYDTLARLYGKL